MILFCKDWGVLKDIKTVVFDVDGVLVDVSRSFRRMILLAVDYYFKLKFDLQGNVHLVTSGIIEIFKQAGGFNNDWDLAAALTYYYLNVYLEKNKPSTLNELKQPSRQLAKEVKLLLKEGPGGLKGFIEVAASKFGFKNEVDQLFDKAYLEEICKTLYAGEKTEQVYGPLKLLQPQQQEIFKRYNLYLLENLLLDESVLNNQLNYGLITGRTSGELLLLMDRLKNLFQKLIHIATDDGDGPRKPSPKLLEFYVEHNLLPLLFIGDSRDDFETVKSAKDHFGDLGFYFAGIASNRDSFNFFQELGADCITYGLNFLLLGLGSD